MCCFAARVRRLMNAYDSAPLRVRKVQEVFFTRPWGLWLQSNSHLVNCTIICCSRCGKKNKGSLIPLCFQTLGGVTALMQFFHIKKPYTVPIWLIIPAGSRSERTCSSLPDCDKEVCSGVVCWPDTNPATVTSVWLTGGGRVEFRDCVFVSVIGAHVSLKLQPRSATPNQSKREKN